MSDAPFVPFYTSDFLGGTGGMTASTRGVYITLLCLMYESEARLHQPWDTLARRCGCTNPAFKKAIQAMCDEGKMTVYDDGLWSHTCDKHIAVRHERSNSAKAAAKRRWKKTEQKQRPDDAGALPPQCKPEPEPDNTVAKATDGDAVDATSKAVWKRGVPFLVERGVPESKARSLIGKWIRDAGAPALFTALADAAKSGTGDPVPYLTQILKPAPSVDDMLAEIAKGMRSGLGNG